MERRFSVFLLLIIIGFNLIWGIGSVPLFDPDEPVYAETAREMIVFQDYLSPRIYNEFWYDKPPMYYWLVAGTFKLFGNSDAAARFPSVLMGILTVVVFYHGLSNLLNQNAAFWSALVLGTCVEFFYLGKAAVTDMTLLFFMLSALMAFLNRKYWLMYIAMALATLTKGPIGVGLPAIIIFLYLLASGNLRELLRMHILRGALLFAVIAVPWYYLMYAAHGKEFIDTFLGFHNITRFTTAEHPTRVLWYYYIPVLILGLFPWTGLLLPSLFSSLRDSANRDFEVMVFMNIWWLFVFIFFSISQTKLVSYILPLFPPLSAIIGWYIAHLAAERFPESNRFLALSSFVIFLLLSYGWHYGSSLLPEVLFAGNILAGITLLLGIMVVIAFFKYRDVNFAAAVHVLTGVLTMFVAFTYLLPPAADRFSVKTVAEYYKSNCSINAQVHIDKFLRPGFMYYTHTPGKELRPKTDDVTKTIKIPGHQYYVVRGTEYRRWKPADKKPLKEIFSHSDIYILEK